MFNQIPNLHQLALTSSLSAVKMASDAPPGSKSSVIFIVTNNFCIWRFSPCLLYNEIEGWPADQMAVKQNQQTEQCVM